MPLRSNAKLWKQSRHDATKYRDRQRVLLPDGTKRDLAGYGATRQAATADLEAKITVVTALKPDGESLSVTELFLDYLQHKRSVKGSKAKTIYDDGERYRVHIKPHIGNKAIGQVTLSDLQNIQSGLTHAGKWRTAELVTILLKSLLSFAHKLYRHEVTSGTLRLVLKDDVDNIKRPPGVTRPVNPLWTGEQIGAFLHLARVRYERQPKASTYPAFYTALAAGLRRGELLGLERSALKERTIKGQTHYHLEIIEQLVDYGGKLNHDTPKTPLGVRRVPLSPAHVELLKGHMKRMDAWAARGRSKPPVLMFPTIKGTPITPRTLYRALHSLCDALGFPHSTLHDLRKAYSSYMTRELVRAGTYSPKLMAQLLGHATTDIALEVYTLLVEDDLLSATLDLGELSKHYPTGNEKQQNTPVQDASLKKAS